MNPDNLPKLPKSQQIGIMNRWSLVFRILNSISFSSVLDVGCGAGILLREIKKKYSCRCYGCDLHYKIDESAKDSLTFTKCDAQELPYKDESFDLVTNLEMVEHLPRPDEFIKEAYRVLTEGGYLLIGTPNWWRFTSIFGRLNKKWSSPKITFSNNRPAGHGHVKEYTPRELSRMVRKSGFEVLAIDYAPFNVCIFPFTRFDLPNLYKVLDDITNIKFLKPFTKAHQYLLAKKLGVVL